MMADHPYSYYTARKLDPIIWFTFVRCIKVVFNILDFFVDHLFGISFLGGSRQERDNASVFYEKSAHVLKVVTRGTLSLAAQHDKTNFLYLHDSYIHPRYVLENENVILRNVTRDSAIFLVSDKNISAYDNKIGPFSFANTFVTAKLMVILPLKHFHRLAEDMGDPIKNHNLKVTIIHMTTRCGSTLLSRYFMLIIFP